MHLEVKKTGELMVLKPMSQNIDALVSNEFKGRVLDLISQGNNYFVLNLSEVKFIDSSGLGAMISILKTITLNNGDIVICELTNPVQNLLTLTRMNSIFKMCASEKEGLESLINLKNKDDA